MNVRIIFVFLCVLVACKAPKKKVATQEESRELIKKSIQINREIPANRSEFTIEGAFIQNDSLIISIAYSGGCEDHDFELYTNGMMAKSLPPQISLTVIHKGKPDNCRNLIRTNQSFGIDTLTSLYQNKMLLRIKDYDKPLLFQPSNINR
jgi:hypothetical protein